MERKREEVFIVTIHRWGRAAAAFRIVRKESRAMKDHDSHEGEACVTALPGETADDAA